MANEFTTSSSPITPQKPLNAGNVINVGGDAGTMRYGGFFFEEPNSEWRDLQRIQLVEEMRRGDGTVKEILYAIKAPLLAAEWFIQSAGEDADSKKISDFVEHDIFNMKRSWKEFLREALAYTDFGYYPFELIFKKGKDGLIHLDDLEPRIPHSVLKFRLSDGRKGITQYVRTDETTLQKLEIPMNKLLVLTHDKEGEDITGQSILRPAYKHYYIKNVLYKISAISAERYGVGVPVAYVPKELGQEEFDKIEEALKNMRANEKSFMAVKGKKGDDYTIEILTPASNSHGNTMVDMLQHHDRMMLASIVAGFLSLGTSATGSFALSKDQSSFFLQIDEDIADYVAEQLTNQVIKTLVDINFGVQDKYPTLEHGAIGDSDLQGNATAYKTLVEGGLLVVDDKLRKFIRKDYSLPELENDEVGIEGIEDPSEDTGGEIAKEEVPTAPEKEIGNRPDLHEYNFAQKKKFESFRPLTLQEERVDFVLLNDTFNDLETDLGVKLRKILQDEQASVIKRIENLIKSGDFAGIAALAFFSRNKLKGIIADYAKQAFDIGKNTASGEIGVKRPAVPLKETQAMNFEATQYADDMANRIESKAKQVAKGGLRKGIAAPAIIAAIAASINSEYDTAVDGVTGSVVGQNINNGRKLVFDQNASLIEALQRSEVLDDVTCDTCMDLDGRIVTPDDPFASMDLVHNNCRGLWIPIMQGEDYSDEDVGISASLKNRFDTVGGVPQINNFKQPKK